MDTCIDPLILDILKSIIFLADFRFDTGVNEPSEICQGSRIKDRMFKENALDLKKKVPSAPTPGQRGL